MQDPLISCGRSEEPFDYEDVAKCLQRRSVPIFVAGFCYQVGFKNHITDVLSERIFSRKGAKA
jgi:hypothetical protein